MRRTDPVAHEVVRVHPQMVRRRLGARQPRTPMFCSHCGTEASSDDQFCKNCGRSLSQPTASPDPEPLPPGGRAGPAWSGQARITTPLPLPAQRTATGRIITGRGGSAEIGGVGRRLGALLIDLGLSIVALFGVAMLIGIGYFAINGIPEDNTVPAGDDETIDLLIWAIGLPLIFLGTWVSNATGGSVGKRILGLRTVNQDLQRPSILRSLNRTLAAWLSWAPLGLGFLWATWDDEARTWHDKLAGTYVVQIDSIVVDAHVRDVSLD